MWHSSTGHSFRVLAVAVSLCLALLVVSSSGEAELILPSDTCWAYGLDPFPPQNLFDGQMPTCCWYHSSTCCFWGLPQLQTSQLRQFYDLSDAVLKQQINITNQCYLSAADILCNGCAGNTNDFVTSRRNPTSGRTEIIVTLCQSTCLLFYNACSSWAKIRGYSKAADFCANFTHSDLLAFSDDEDYYGDVVYRVARNDRNCYLGEGIRSGLSIIEAQVGRCIPPLGTKAPPKKVSPPPNPNKHHTQVPQWPFNIAPATVSNPFTASSVLIRGVASTLSVSPAVLVVYMVLLSSFIITMFGLW